LTEDHACDIVFSYFPLPAPGIAHRPLSYNGQCENYDAHIKAFEGRKRLEEVLRIYDSFSHFSRTESLVLEVLRERGALRGSEITASILSSGLADVFINRQVYVMLTRLQKKGWVVAEKQNGKFTEYRLTEKAELAFRAWKMIGTDFMFRRTQQP